MAGEMYGRKAYFLTLLLVFLLLLTVILVSGDRALTIPLGSRHPFWLNVFFVNYTFMGDGIFAVCLSAFVGLYLQKRTTGIQLFAGFMISAFLVQLMKNLISPAAITLFVEQGQYLFFTDEQVLANYHSLPSGHTATAFSITTILALNIRSVKAQFSLLFAAMLLAFSRMYLAQHQLGEIVVAVITGSISGILAVEMLKWKIPVLQGRITWRNARSRTTVKVPDLQSV